MLNRRVDAKELRKESLLFRLLVLFMFIEMISLPLAFSSLTSSTTIKSTGSISPPKEEVAKSGSAKDIQAAVDAMAALGGGTVYIPSGTFFFNDETVSIPGGVNVIGQGSGSTILHENKTAPFNRMFQVDGSNGKSTRISGIRFEGNVTSSEDSVNGIAIGIDKAIDFRVDHCIFMNFPQMAIYVGNTITGTTRGVIDHNIFDNPYKDTYGGGMWAYGIVINGQAWSWDNSIDSFLGKYETAPSRFPIVYIEDNNFSRCRHAIASNQGAWYVARYNIIREERPKNFGSIDVHGSAGGGSPGGRGLEAYNNTIIGSVGYDAAQAFWIRGGGGVIFNNTMQNILYGVGLYKDVDNPLYYVKDLYIWGNNINGGALINNYAGYTEGVDYFLSVKSGYTPYPYPHPLTLEATP